MAMEKCTFKVSYEARDENGNGNGAAFDQTGIPIGQLMELQAPVMRMVAEIQAVLARWAAAKNAVLAKGPVSPGGGPGQKGP